MSIRHLLTLCFALVLPLISVEEARAANGANDAPPDSPPVQPPRGDKGRGIERALLVVEPRLGVGMRNFGYADRISPNQRSYSLQGVPLIGISGEVYPFAAMSGSGIGGEVLGGLGLTMSYDRAVFLQSAMANAQSTLASAGAKDIDTTWSNFDIGVRSRFALGDRAVLGAKAGYGSLDFSFSGADALGPQLPSATYRFIRAGVDARVTIWVFALTAGMDYLAVSDAGDLTQRYPHSSVGGIDANFGVALPLASHVEARTGVRYQRFFYSMHPEVGDANVAGGALDELGRWDSSIAIYY